MTTQDESFLLVNDGLLEQLRSQLVKAGFTDAKVEIVRKAMNGGLTESPRISLAAVIDGTQRVVEQNLATNHHGKLVIAARAASRLAMKLVEERTAAEEAKKLAAQRAATQSHAEWRKQTYERLLNAMVDAVAEGSKMSLHDGRLVANAVLDLAEAGAFDNRPETPF